MIYHDGWYYLLVTHGSCCAGRELQLQHPRWAARSKVTGPFLDNMGIDMLQGGGKLFAGSGGRLRRPRPFRPARSGDGVQKFSCHYEADLDRGGVSVLDIRPLLWRDGWPVAGEQRQGGHVRDRVGAHRHGARAGRAGRAGRRSPRTRRSWRGRQRPPARRRRLRHRRFRRRRHRRSRRTGRPASRRAHGALPAPGAAEMDDRAGRQCRRLSRLAVLQDHASPARIARWRPPRMANWSSLPAFTGAPEQLWRIDQLADGTYRVMPKAVPNASRTAGALRRRQQHADAREVRSRQRSPALAHRGRRDRAHDETLLALSAAAVAALAATWRFRRPRGAQDGPAVPRPPAPSLTRPVGASAAGRRATASSSAGWCSSRSRRAGQLTESAVQAALQTAATCQHRRPRCPHDGDR